MQIPDFSAYQLEPVPNLKLPLPKGDFWVFGYGSLMWDPGFKYIDSQPAFLFGYHRRLCLWSIHYRGTHANPGLVLGLDAGGSCKGMGFKVSPKNTEEVCEYLKEREMLSNAYKPVVKPIYLDNGKNVNALTFVSKRNHPQYANIQDNDLLVSIIQNAKGLRGPNCQYVTNTANHLSEFGIHKTHLHDIADQLIQ